MTSVQTYDAQDLNRFVRGRDARDRVGKALTRAYPGVKWLVVADAIGGVVQITVPQISNEFGMILHMRRDGEDLEREAVRKGGEMLERFRVSRVAPDFAHIHRRINGEALCAAEGEQ